jgi:hypothetical protein
MSTRALPRSAHRPATVAPGARHRRGSDGRRSDERRARPKRRAASRSHHERHEHQDERSAAPTRSTTQNPATPASAPARARPPARSERRDGGDGRASWAWVCRLRVPADEPRDPVDDPCARLTRDERREGQRTREARRPRPTRRAPAGFLPPRNHAPTNATGSRAAAPRERLGHQVGAQEPIRTSGRARPAPGAQRPTRRAVATRRRRSPAARARRLRPPSGTRSAAGQLDPPQQVEADPERHEQRAAATAGCYAHRVSWAGATWGARPCRLARDPRAGRRFGRTAPPPIAQRLEVGPDADRSRCCARRSGGHEHRCRRSVRPSSRPGCAEQRLPARVAGADLAPISWRTPRARGWRVASARRDGEVVAAVARTLTADGVRIVFHRDGLLLATTRRTRSRRIHRAAPDLLLIAMGSPRTEHFVVRTARGWRCR